LLLLSTVLGIVLISAGVFDPKPLGSLQRTLELKSISVGPEVEDTHWLIDALGQDEASLRLSAAWKAGENDVGYGLCIGDDENYLVVGISPLGYATVQYRARRVSQESGLSPIFPWQTWPHINSDQVQNEIWVDIQQGFVTTIRVNGEILFQDRVALPGEKVGLWIQSFGRGVEIGFEDLRLYYPEKSS